jgi:hypothetical protein
MMRYQRLNRLLGYGEDNDAAHYYCGMALPPKGQNNTLKAHCIKCPSGKYVPKFYDDPLVTAWKKDTVMNLTPYATPFTCDVTAHVVFFMGDNLHDVDSFLKKTIDVLSGIAYGNDRKVRRCVVEKVMCSDFDLIEGHPILPHTEVLIERYDLSEGLYQ